MTTRDRMLSVYRNQMPDQLPVGIYTRFLQRGRFERDCRALGVGLFDCVPVISLMAPLWHVLDGYVSEVRNARFKTQYDWQKGETVITHEYETPAGKASRSSSAARETHSEWITKYYIQTAADYDAVQYLVENTVFTTRHEEFRQRVADMGDDGVVIARIDRSGYQKLIIELGDPQQVMIDLYTQPEKPERLIQTLNRRLEEQFELVLASPAEVIWQPENVSADMTPPDLFRKYCLPVYQKFAERARQAGKVYIVHMDGRLKAIKDLIAQSSIQVIESFSLPEMANDLALTDARKAWGTSVICPNFPAALCDRSESEIAARLDALVKDMGADTPFMLAVSEDLPQEAYPRIMPMLARYFQRNRKA